MMTRRAGRVALASILLMSFAASALRVGAQAEASSASTLLDGSALNDIWLRINARDWQDLHAHYLDDTYYPVDLEWQGTTVRNAGIRVRGKATRNDHKPSFRVDFNRYVGGQELFGLDAIVLNNAWHDPSMTRDRLSMLLFRTLGIPAPRQAHVRLFVGAARDYVGVYAISEEIDEDFLTSTLHDPDGYLFEFHRQDDDYYGFQNPGPNLDWYVPRFDPKTHASQSVATLYAPIRGLVEAVSVARAPELERDLAGYLDVRTFITQLAVQIFLAQTDGLVGGVGMNNFYLYRAAGTGMSLLIPWDQDNSFTQINMPPWQHLESNVLTAKIWSEPKYRDMYLATLLDIADLAGSGWLEGEALREYEQIREAAYADPFTPYSRERFEEDSAIVRQFARERAAIVRQYVSDVAPEVFTTRRR
jgi:spore coat protein CotH